MCPFSILGKFWRLLLNTSMPPPKPLTQISNLQKSPTKNWCVWVSDEWLVKIQCQDGSSEWYSVNEFLIQSTQVFPVVIPADGVVGRRTDNIASTVGLSLDNRCYPLEVVSHQGLDNVDPASFGFSQLYRRDRLSRAPTALLCVIGQQLLVFPVWQRHPMPIPTASEVTASVMTLPGAFQGLWPSSSHGHLWAVTGDTSHLGVITGSVSGPSPMGSGTSLQWSWLFCSSSCI